MRIILFIIVSATVTFSCGRKNHSIQNASKDVIRIDLLAKVKNTIKNLSDIGSKIEYIPLQTSKNSLLSGIVAKIVESGGRIYIQSRSEILCFEKDGRFLNKLQKEGRGPEEYTSISDFDVSSDNKKLLILAPKKVFIYAISDVGFAFQKSISLRDPAPWKLSAVPGTENFILAIPPWRGNEPTLSLIMNTKGDTVIFKPNSYNFKMQRRSITMALNEMLVYSVGGMACFKEEFSDTVFYTGSGENRFKPRIIFNSHGSNIKAEMRGSPERPANNTTFIPKIVETYRYIFFSVVTMVDQNFILFDKTSMTNYRLDFDRDMRIQLTDDLNGGPQFSFDFLKDHCSGGKLYSFLQPVALKKYVEGEEFKGSSAKDHKMKQLLSDLARSLNETDNPILVVLTMKQ